MDRRGLDMVFHEDKQHKRANHATKNFATVLKKALILAQNASKSLGTKSSYANT
jgi:hypothetical protein